MLVAADPVTVPVKVEPVARIAGVHRRGASCPRGIAVRVVRRRRLGIRFGLGRWGGEDRLLGVLSFLELGSGGLEAVLPPVQLLGSLAQPLLALVERRLGIVDLPLLVEQRGEHRCRLRDGGL